MNAIDLLLFVILIWSAVRGFMKGFVVQLFSLAALLIGVYCAYTLSHFVAGYLSESLSTDPVFTNIVAFAITFIGVWALVYLTGKLAHQLVKVAMLGTLNRLLGAFFALLKSLLIISVLFAIFMGFNSSFHFISQETINGSVMCSVLQKICDVVFPYITFGFIPQGV